MKDLAQAVRRKVLVIEDNEDNMLLISTILRSRDYSPLAAWTGEQGIKMACRERPGVIVLDIQLPDMNGLDVLERLRADPRCKDIPIVAMTSFAMAGDGDRMLSAGCNGYIEKPIDPATVVARIEEFVAGAVAGHD